MQYKTIVLRFLEQHPKKYDKLRHNRMLLPTLDAYARQLKTRHEAWKHHLSLTKPASGPSQITSEALELALNEMEKRFLLGSPSPDKQLSLDEAINSIRHHTPPA